ncbi:MAG: HlyD family efflux transporter periplasmic adaptor subunit [Emticicia sp.]|nr:HlyD family efflux transporter periplasmic adaptor subunit [Emticicia sp.]
MKKISLFLSIILAISLFSCGKKTETATVQRKDITEMVFATGSLKADDEYLVAAQADGYLKTLNFEEGDVINAGKVLAVIDNKQSLVNVNQTGKLLAIAKANATENAPLIQQIRININLAKEKLKQDELQAERFRKLLETNSIAKVEYENATLAVLNTKANIRSLEEQIANLQVNANQQVIVQQQQNEVSNAVADYNQIIAYVSGKVYKKRKQLGDYVKKGDVIAVIGNPNKIYANLSIDESNMSKIKLGQSVVIQLNTNAQKTYKAQIAEILPAFDEATQSFFVKAFFSENLDFTIVGTQLQANILIGEKKNALVIPRSYLGYGNKVLLKDKKTVVVKTGIISTDWAEITGGLPENETILKELL